MTSKVEIREKELKKLSVIFANWIGTNSAVSDDWLSEIKTYYNIELSDSETLHLFTLMRYIEITDCSKMSLSRKFILPIS